MSRASSLGSVEYKLNRHAAFITGTLFVVIGAFALVIGLVIIKECELSFFLPFAFVLFLIPAIYVTAKNTVKIDAQQKTVVKTTEIFGWSRSKVYRLWDFHSVQIRRYFIGSGHDHVPYALYYLQLNGGKNVSIPGSSSNIEEIYRKGWEVARLMRLPLNWPQI